MRIVSTAIIAAALSLGALAAAAQDAKPEATTAEAAIRIPAAQLKFYCFKGSGVYSIGAVTCLSRGQWGTCKWTGQGTNFSAPQARAYWVASIAPSGSCP